MEPDQPMQPNVGFPGSMPQSVAPRPKSNKWIYIAIIIFLLIIALITFLVFRGSSTSGEEELVEGTPVPTIEATSSPTPTPAPIGKDKVKIQVLNGTGVAGEAGFLQTQLKSLGYKIVDTGNSEKSDATSTTVNFSSGVDPVVVEEITTKLKALYKTVDTNTSSSSTTHDIVITTGPRKTAAATSTPAATKSPSPSPTSTP